MIRRIIREGNPGEIILSFSFLFRRLSGGNTAEAPENSKERMWRNGQKKEIPAVPAVVPLSGRGGCLLAWLAAAGPEGSG